MASTQKSDLMRKILGVANNVNQVGKGGVGYKLLQPNGAVSSVKLFDGMFRTEIIFMLTMVYSL